MVKAALSKLGLRKRRRGRGRPRLWVDSSSSLFSTRRESRNLLRIHKNRIMPAHCPQEDAANSILAGRIQLARASGSVPASQGYVAIQIPAALDIEEVKRVTKSQDGAHSPTKNPALSVTDGMQTSGRTRS